MVVIRRFLLTGIGSTAVTTLAVILTSVEEILFRATLVPRDELFTRLFVGEKVVTEAQLARGSRQAQGAVAGRWSLPACCSPFALHHLKICCLLLLL